MAGPRRIEPVQRPTNATVISESRTSLWIDGRDDEFVLRCGKVQNLRIAARHFNGVEVAAGQVLGFWAQVGPPVAWRRFAVGREILNGCVVPTMGGGICQLSNALATVAVAAGVSLVERHRHSAVIEGSPSAPSEDATVAWNHVDLRMRADFAFRVEARLSSTELIVRIHASRSGRPRIARAPIPVSAERHVAHGCLTCDRAGCFRHAAHQRPWPATGRSACLLNDHSPEAARWLAVQAPGVDWMLPYSRPGRRPHAWTIATGGDIHIATWSGLKRMARQQLHRGEGAARQVRRQTELEDLARAYARRLRPEHIELKLTQDLLVPLWRLDALAGRAFDVFVHELPASSLQARLDAAAVVRPSETSLQDFRVDGAWTDDEWSALAAARSRTTAHRKVHDVLEGAGLTTELVPWIQPPPAPRARIGDPRLTLTLPASALARKGANEVACVARRLGAKVVILGTAPGDVAVWSGVDWQRVGYAARWIELTDIVVLPAHVEHRPRAVLQGLSSGVPAVVSSACGLGNRPGLTEVEPGCVEELEAAICEALHFEHVVGQAR